MARVARMRPTSVTPTSLPSFSAASNAAIVSALVWVRLARVG